MNELQKIIDIIQNIIVKSFAIDEDKLIKIVWFEELTFFILYSYDI